jgi:hypothetical protein
MKKLTQEKLKTRQDAEKAKKALENAAEKTDAKCCAKTSKNRVGCHD